MAEEFGVTFDGYDTTQLLRVTSLDRGIGPSRSSRTSKRNGKKVYTTLARRQIC